MRHILATSAIAALAIALAGFSGDTGQRKGGTGGDRAQQMEQQKAHDQERQRTQVESKKREEVRNEEIYGHEMMTAQERKAYQEKLRNMKSEEERARFIAQHRAKMEDRARAKAKETEEAE